MGRSNPQKYKTEIKIWSRPYSKIENNYRFLHKDQFVQRVNSARKELDVAVMTVYASAPNSYFYVWTLFLAHTVTQHTVAEH